MSDPTMVKNLKDNHKSPRKPSPCLLGLMLLAALIGCKSTEDKSPSPFGSCEATSPPPATDNSVQTDPFEVQFLTEIIESDRCLVVEDIDGDGHLDILIADRGDVEDLKPPRLVFYWGHGDGTFDFDPFNIPYRPDGGCALGDLDDDGEVDIVLGGKSGLFTRRLVPIMGQGERKFLVESERVELPDDYNNLAFYTLALVDVDATPGLEILYGTAGMVGPCTFFQEENCEVFVDAQMKILRQDEDGVFRDAPDLLPSSIHTYVGSHVHTVIGADLNHDGLGDYLIGTDVGRDFLLQGSPKGGLIDVSKGTGLSEYNHTMGFALSDFNGDGKRDLYLTDLGLDFLFVADCDHFSDASKESNISDIARLTNSWGVVAFDVELDGDVDIFTTNSDIWPEDWAEQIDEEDYVSTPVEWAEYQHHFLLKNDGNAHFEKIELPHLDGTNKSWFQFTVAAGDLDEDGDQDMVLVERPTEVDIYESVSTDTNPRIYFNQAEHQGHWLTVIPRDEKGRPARDVRVTLIQETGTRMQDLYPAGGTGGHFPFRAHFGLGEDDAPLTVRIRWRDGEITEIPDVVVDQAIVVDAP